MLIAPNMILTATTDRLTFEFNAIYNPVALEIMNTPYPNAAELILAATIVAPIKLVIRYMESIKSLYFILLSSLEYLWGIRHD